MSLIARCPACATLFRVVPDQLKISDGWVRCGQCSEVFDAMVNMQVAGSAPIPAPTPIAVSEPEPAPAPAPAPQPAPAPAPAPEPEPAPAPAPEPEPEQAARDLALLESDTLRLVAEAAREPALDVTPAPDVAPVPEPLRVEPQEDPRPSEPTGDPVLEPGPLAGDTPHPQGDAPTQAPVSHALPDGTPDTTTEPSPEPEPALRDMAFVRQAQRRAFWQSRRMRITLGVLGGVLSLTLCMQVVFHHRDRIASQAPALRPLLTALCASFQCRLGPPRRIESIAIESSAFTRVRADAFRLSLTLSNQADIALAMPALELTLTDVQDQPVLRRVLQPADLGPQAPQVIEARAEWTSTLTLAIAPQANPARIVGYRVLAFYP